MTYTPNKWHRQKNTWRILAGTRPVVEINSYNDDAEAVAALVVAAPELLEALQNLASLVRNKDGSLSLGTYEVGLIEKAIAKATQS